MRVKNNILCVLFVRARSSARAFQIIIIVPAAYYLYTRRAAAPATRAYEDVYYCPFRNVYLTRSFVERVVISGFSFGFVRT